MPINHPTTGPGIGGPEWEEDHTVPTLAEVLAAGNDPNGTAIQGSAGQDVFLSGGLGDAITNGGKSRIFGGDAPDAAAGGDVHLIAGWSGNAVGATVKALGGTASGDGGDVLIEAGAGDGGRNGLVFLNLPTSDPSVSGALFDDGTGVRQSGDTAPTLAEVLVAGNDVGGQTIKGITAVSGGGVSGGQGPVLQLKTADDGGDGGAGGTVNLSGGAAGGVSGGAADGGYANLIGGAGWSGSANNTAALISAGPGLGTGDGGIAGLYGGAAASGSNAPGGDITLAAGTGDGAGRNGLVFLNLPTSDPGVSGALYSLAGVVKVSA